LTIFIYMIPIISRFMIPIANPQIMHILNNLNTGISFLKNTMSWSHITSINNISYNNYFQNHQIHIWNSRINSYKKVWNWWPYHPTSRSFNLGLYWKINLPSLTWIYKELQKSRDFRDNLTHTIKSWSTIKTHH